MKKLLIGNHAVSYGAMLSRAEVIAAYPITPQTQVVEELAELCASGKLKAQFIKVESEHSAMSACIGAAQAGARAFTATSSQGLALMHEVLHWAANARLPIVMANINRAMAPGWNIWADHIDSLAQRDTGWMQFYAETNQEVLDTIIIAYKVCERVLLPAMINLDAFFLSHTAESVEIPEQDMVDEFLPPYNPEIKLDPDDPRAFGGLLPPKYYMEMRYKLHSAHRNALKIIEEEEKNFFKIFKRKYGLVDEFYTKDAQIIIVTSSTITSTAREFVMRERKKGRKLGLLKVRVFRPFPAERIRRALKNCQKVVVIDRNISYGNAGIFATEIKSALYGFRNVPVFGFVAGLGGRDVQLEDIEGMVDFARKKNFSKGEIWWGLKK